MAVKRIVANLGAKNPRDAIAFYRDMLGLELVMDQGWIVTLAAPQSSGHHQLSFASEGGSGTPVPELSIEVDDLEAVLERLKGAGIPLDYGPADEPWGVRRFFVRDPLGRLINILSHSAS